MAPLRAITVGVDALTAAQREAAWRVFARHYEGAERTRFERDLDGKQHVFLLLDDDADEPLVGFSTVRTDRVTVRGRAYVSVFSGDTVLEAHHRGQTALQWAFFRYLVATKLRHPHRPVVWFLISKGYKTYLLLAKNFPHFWPRRDAPTPPWARELITTLARNRFGEALDPAAGVLRFEADHEHLRPDVAPVDGQDDPDIRFFATANPGHAHGDELCCIGMVDRTLLWAYPVKLVRRRLRRTGR